MKNVDDEIDEDKDDEANGGSPMKDLAGKARESTVGVV